jgi:hypothetical protein
MGTKSKFFRCFVEGQTISDKRVVTAEMIDQIVETHNVETYSPRINVEHLKGYSPEPPFNGYGDVFAVKAQTDTITIDGKAEQRRALYAQVDANDQLVALGKADQKPYPSVELTDDYAGTGKVGLIGLAFTDSPASIATQRLQFSRTAPGTVRAIGDEPVKLEFASDTNSITAAIVAGFANVAGMFRASEEKKKEEPATPPAPKPANDNAFDVQAFSTANDNAFDVQAFSTAIGEQLVAAIKPIADAQAAFETRFDALEGQLAKTEQPNGFSRPLSTGGGNASFITDC